MKAYLIDPIAKAITEVQNPDWEMDAMHTTIECQTYASVSLGAGVYLWVDDDGFLKDGLAVFRIGGRRIAGRGLMLGITPDGSNADCPVDLNQIEPLVEWTDLVGTGDFEGAGPTPYGYTMGTPVLRPRADLAERGGF